MGTLLSPHCRACGFEADTFHYGGGMMDHGTVTNVPAIDTRTGEFTTVNIKDPDADSHIVPYSDPSLHQGPIDVMDSYHWGETNLPKKGNKCPRCGKFTLSFEVRGFWD